jgi:hypothetical protein
MDESHPDTRYRRLFDAAIADALQQALRIIRADPHLLLAGTSLLGTRSRLPRPGRPMKNRGFLYRL